MDLTAIIAAAKAAANVPVPIGERHHYRDGTVDFFSYGVQVSHAWYAIVAGRLASGRSLAVEMRMSDGSLVIVRPRNPEQTPNCQ